MIMLNYLKSTLICTFVNVLIFPAFGFSQASEDMDTLLPRIDTHIHLYDTRREGSATFLDPVKHEKIYFPHFAEQFIDTAGPSGINYAVVVEASQRREDNFWLQQHVDTSDALVAFIANLDPRDATFAQDLEVLSRSPKFRGIRIRPTTPINLGDQKIIESFVELARRNLVLELGGNGVDPAVIEGIARRYPNMNIIMNHLAGGSMQGTQVLPSDWKARLAVFASEPNVYCKISMLYALSGKNPAPVYSEYYKPLIDPVIDAFGPDRVMFGSNWTLSDMLGSYSDMIIMLDDFCAKREDLSPEKFYYQNASKAYGINQSKPEYPGNGNGLLRSFWEGELGGRNWFLDSLCSDLDPEIDEDWGTEGPGCSVRNSFWNARWEGYLEPVVTGDHTFYVTINDYCRLWINEELIIDAWKGGMANACYTGNIELTAMEKVSIKVEYANLLDQGFIRLEWEGPGLPREVIPVSQLYEPLNTTRTKNYTPGKNSLHVYPNPSANSITLSAENLPLEEVRISNSAGRMIFREKENTTKLVVNVAGWPPGLYFIENMRPEGRCLTKLMIE